MGQTHESRLNLSDGTDIFVRDWLPDEPGNGKQVPCIVILHGLGEHCGRYLHVASFLNSNGFAVRTYDHRGHGQSSGSRADVPGSMTLINDAEFIIRDFAHHFSTSPILLGHSMGGLYAARIATAATVPLRGLILSSPALALRLTGLDRLLLKLMTAIAPHVALSNNLNSSHLSHDPLVSRAYDNDPLVHKKITASLLNSMLAAIDSSLDQAPESRIPTLLLVAENDKLIDPRGSHDFFERLPKDLATAHFYPDLYHEIFNEIKAAMVFDDLKQWLSVQKFIA